MPSCFFISILLFDVVLCSLFYCCVFSFYCCFLYFNVCKYGVLGVVLPILGKVKIKQFKFDPCDNKKNRQWNIPLSLQAMAKTSDTRCDTSTSYNGSILIFIKSYFLQLQCLTGDNEGAAQQNWTWHISRQRCGRYATKLDSFVCN